MTEARGIADDRRRSRHNPFPSLTDTEYELFLMTIEMVVTGSVERGMAAYRKSNCDGHIERTRAVEVVVFGSTEAGVVGLDQRMASVESVMQRWDDDRKWFRRMVYSAFATAIVGVAIGVVQFIMFGGGS